LDLVHAMIDAHHHFWQYDPEQYAWIGPQMQVLQQDFMPNDLKALTDEAGVDGVVSVQARQSLAETEWLLSMAESHDWIRGVVGWAPLVDANIAYDLQRFAGRDKLKGIRHVLHDEPDDYYMDREAFNRGLSLLVRLDLVYDILIFARHLPQTIGLVDRHPNQRFVLDHVAKPEITAARFDEQWQRDIRTLAKRPNVMCKFSGVVTEVRDAEWNIDLIRPYWDTVLEAFGPGRLMFGSDWPVCLLRTDYARWAQTERTLVSELSDDEQRDVLHNTAARTYQLDD
jgi:L-fuconolactonase